MGALAISLSLAFSAGLNLYAAIGVLGIAARLGLVGPLPASLGWASNTWVIALALVLLAIEFVATITPGVASAWETVHSVIRPPAAAIIAAATVWREDPLIVLAAAFLGGSLAIVVHTAQLGMRYAIDTRDEARTGVLANIVELSLVSAVVLLAWSYPLPTLSIALGVLAAFMIAVRVAVHALRQVFTGHWMPGCGLLQEPRTVGTPTSVELVDEEDAASRSSAASAGT